MEAPEKRENLESSTDSGGRPANILCGDQRSSAPGPNRSLDYLNRERHLFPGSYAALDTADLRVGGRQSIYPIAIGEPSRTFSYASESVNKNRFGL